MNVGELIHSLQGMPIGTPVVVESTWGMDPLNCACVDTITGNIVFTPYGTGRLKEIK